MVDNRSSVAVSKGEYALSVGRVALRWPPFGPSRNSDSSGGITYMMKAPLALGWVSCARG
jgi:hypothetical protein